MWHLHCKTRIKKGQKRQKTEISNSEWFDIYSSAFLKAEGNYYGFIYFNLTQLYYCSFFHSELREQLKQKIQSNLNRDIPELC